ncbi:MAG: hypothetical protein EB157_04260, partial [Euryarchaeota archaeon]|nr:hypothetical protein [Euryarchaeota archaeon]
SKGSGNLDLPIRFGRKDPLPPARTPPDSTKQMFYRRVFTSCPTLHSMSDNIAGPNVHLGIRISILKGLLIALVLLLLASPVAALSDDDDDADDEDDDDADDEDVGDEFEDLGEDVGTVSAWLLGLTLVYFGWKRVLPTIRKHLKQTEQKERLKSLNTWNKKAIPLHTLLGVAALVTGTIHGLMMDEDALILWVAVALMGVLSISGGLMRWKWPPKKVKKGARLLHMQRLLSAAVVILLLVGHEMV